MKRFAYFLCLSAGLLAGTFFFQSCQKDAVQDAAKAVDTETPVTGRALVSYGVTLYDGVNPCSIVEIANGTGNVTAITPQAFYIDNGNNVINLDNLKGICLTGWGQYFLTTGDPANPGLPPGLGSIYNNALFKVNPLTGQCSFASTNGANGPVSDLEHNPQNSNFYGLRNNSNAIYEIVDNNNNYGTYNGPFQIQGIAFGYTLKGLSLVDDGNGPYLAGCATSANLNDPAILYRIPANGGLANVITTLGPVADLATGHCGIGFDMDNDQMIVNRANPFLIGSFGLNNFAWNPPFAPVTPTALWGGKKLNYEDLTSDVQ